MTKYAIPQAGTRGAKRLARKNTRVPIQTMVLRTLYATGIISIALVAPKALKLFTMLDGPKNARKRMYRRIDQALYRLHQKGLVTLSLNPNGRPFATMTEKGRSAIEKAIVGDYQISESVTWDGKWRMVIFDIKERRRRVRQQLWFLLKKTGFARLQDSVWVYPYPCDEYVQLLRSHLASGTGELQYFTTDSLESDRHLRDHFRLP